MWNFCLRRIVTRFPFSLPISNLPNRTTAISNRCQGNHNKRMASNHKTLVPPTLPIIKTCEDLKTDAYDCCVVVSSSIKTLPLSELRDPLESIRSIDESAENDQILLIPSSLPSKRIVFSGTGPLNRDYDDVRRFSEAAEKGMKRALAAGSKSPLLVINKSDFDHSEFVSILGALGSLYVPIEVREDVTKEPGLFDKIGIFCPSKSLNDILAVAKAVEMGKVVCRDIGGSDPERMAAPRVEEYVRRIFEGTDVKVEVLSGQDVFEKEYPCFAAVNRAASGVERHSGRVIWLSYTPTVGGPIKKTVMLVGKGVTYDTGGADIKAGGIMAGMSRDKCGAAVVAGFVKTASMLQRSGVKVVGAMAMVRNSVGSNAYVSDEIITARNGVRLRVGNTDAEGRMAMVDVLCHMREKSLQEVNPHLLTVATLTGHAVLAVGPYSIVMDNGPAKKESFAQSLQFCGNQFGDPFEVSTLRREDYDMIFDKSKAFVSVLQCNNVASSRTPRGHQFPGAFLHHVSGLDDHMCNSNIPLKYSHLDIAGSSGNLPEPTTGAAVTALAMRFLEPL